MNCDGELPTSNNKPVGTERKATTTQRIRKARTSLCPAAVAEHHGARVPSRQRRRCEEQTTSTEWHSDASGGRSDVVDTAQFARQAKVHARRQHSHVTQETIAPSTSRVVVGHQSGTRDVGLMLLNTPSLTEIPIFVTPAVTSRRWRQCLHERAEGQRDSVGMCECGSRGEVV